MNRTSTAWSGLCLLALVAFASGSWATSVEFSPDQLTFQKTDTSTQNVGIFVKSFPAGTDLGGALFLLQYDTNALEISNVVFDNTILDLKGLDTPVPGGLSISANKLMATGTVSDAKALVTFDVKRKTDTPGNYPVTFAVGDPLNALKDLVTQDIAVASWGTLTVQVTEGPPDPVQDLALTMVQRQRDPIKVGLTWNTGKVTSVEAQRLEGGNWVNAPAGLLTWIPATKTLEVNTGVVGVETFDVRLRGLDQGQVWDGTAAVDAAANPDVGWVQPPTALTVDNEAPDLTSAVANKEGTKITATFQAGEILDDATALTAGNYAASIGDPPDAPAATLINVTNVTKLGDNQVQLTLASALPREGDLFLGAWSVQDDLGNAIVGTDVVPVTLPAFPPTDAFINVDAPRQKDPIKGAFGWTNGFTDDAESQYSDDGGANWHPFDATSDEVNKTWEWDTDFAGTKNLDLRVRFTEKGQVWNGTAIVDAAANPDAGWVTASVILDNEAPVPQSASGAGNLVSITFKTDEALDPGSVATLANYEVVDMGVITAEHAGALPITEARLAAGTQNVVELVLGENLLATQRYQVSVKDVVDAVGNAQATPVDLELTTEPRPGKNVAVVLNAGARQKDDVVIDLTWTDGFATSLELQYDAGGGWTDAAGAVADIGAKQFTWTTGFAAPTALQVRARVIHRGKVWDGTANVDATPNVGWSAPVALTVDNEPPTPVSAAGSGNMIELAFQAGEVLHADDVKNTGHYVVTDEGVATTALGDVIGVTKAALKAGATNVVMLTLASELSPAQKYKLAVQNVIDAVGNAIAQTTYLNVITEPKPGKNVAVVLNAGARQKDDVVIDLTWTDGFATALELQYDTGGGWTNAAGAVGDTDAKTITWNSPFGGTQALQVRARVVHRGKVWDGTQNVDAAANPNVGWSAPVALTVDNELPDPVSAAGQRDSADVVVTFNAGELLDETVAEDLASYTVTDEGVITTNGSPVLPLASANLEAAGNVVTLTLQSVPGAGKKYKVMVNAAKDVAGNELAAPKGLDFEIPANPELVSAAFVNRTRVRATFDKVMDIATLGAADWTLTAAGGGTVAVTNVSDTGDGKSFNLTTALLAQKTNYTLTAPPNGADTGGLTVRPDKDEATFTSRRWFDFAAGTRTIGIPLTDAGRVLTLTGADGVARYDAGAGAYVIDKAVGGAEEIQQVPGMGYFAKFNAARTAYFDGDPLASPVAFNAPAGWSIISPPRNITLGNTNPAISYAWYYDGTGYVLKANIPAGGLNVVDDKLDAWKGYFIKRAAAGNVQIGTAQANAAPISFGDDAKLVQLVASAGDLADSMNFCGIGGDAVEIANPPLVDGAVDLAFAGSSDALAVDVRTGDLAQKWDLVVTTSLPNTAVTVSAPDLSMVPPEYAVILTDKESGKSCYLRTSAGFTFDTGADGASRKMTLEIVPRTGAALVSSMSVQSGTGAAVVTYGLSGPASVTAEVLNIAGRKVRQIVADRVETAGTHTLVWNLSSDAGTAVPRGLYMIVIQARSEDGQQVRAVRPLSVNR
ncbi:MAG: FlgD immunoglobulin-like domain containing protein [Acidobacteriota bacterium]|nr:FlgD immunoglobulin-like domain containing protein [Acidobacteriota bacterium]